MAARKTQAGATPPLNEIALGELAAEIARRVNASGSIPRSELSVPKSSLAALTRALEGRGLEVKPRVVRRPLDVQLLAVLAGGAIPIKGIERRVAGGTRAEVRAALAKLVSAKRAAVLRGADKDGEAALAAGDLLTAADRTRIGAVAKALAALAKAPGKSPMAPRSRWADVTSLLDDVLGHGAGGAHPANAARSASEETRPDLSQTLLQALRAGTDASSGIASVPAAVRSLGRELASSEVVSVLRDLAGRGDIELRIASQPHLLPPDERAMCPTDPAGRVLAYARVIES